jgi:hypothetical protein
MDACTQEQISTLTVKNILNLLKGGLTFSRDERLNKNILLDSILMRATPEQLQLLRDVALEKETTMQSGQLAKAVSRKRKSEDIENTHRTKSRLDSTLPDNKAHDVSKFLEVPTEEDVK